MTFLEITLDAFSFLLRDYGCRVVSQKDDDCGASVTFQNGTTAIRVSFDRREAGPFVTLYRLKNGQIPQYPVFFDPDSEFLVFDLNDLLMIRTGKIVPQDPEQVNSPDYMRAKVDEFARSMQSSAKDILTGDFTVLPLIKQAVSRRAKGW